MNRDLPFSRWRLRPHPGEPSYSYFVRLVADEGHGSMKIYATEIGINGRNFVPEVMLDVLQRLPLTAEEHKRLRMATPIDVDGTYQVGNELLRPKQLSFRTRRFCPHCLAEKPYHRIQWDIVVASHCPIHGSRLISEVGGKPLKWWWPHFDVSPTGDNMIDNRPTSSATDLPFHTMLRTRLEFGCREVGPTADMVLFEIVEPAAFFGRFHKDGQLTHPRSNKECDIETGFAIVAMTHDERVEWFRNWCEVVIPAETRRRGFHESMGKGFVDKRHGGRTSNPVWDAIEQARYEGFALVGTFGRKSAKRQAERGDRTLKEAADELGVPVKGLRPFIKQLDLLPEAKWNGDAHSIDQATFSKLRDLIDDLITLPETTAITGIPGWEFRRVVRAGFVQEFSGLRRDGVGGPKYLGNEVSALVTSIRMMTENKPDKGMKTLLGYARQKELTQGEVIKMILAGNLKLAAADNSRTGLRALYL
jgi:hypothetical protein